MEAPKYITVDRFKHCFDLGVFLFFKDTGDDGTAYFYEEDEFNKCNPIKPEARLIKYRLSEMRPAF